MHEEIFGPVLPVNSYGSLNEAIEYVRGRERPLALYVFSNSRKKHPEFNEIHQLGKFGGKRRGPTLFPGTTCPWEASIIAAPAASTASIVTGLFPMNE